MTKLFFDHLLNLDEVDKTVKKVTSNHDEKIEIWQIIDELIHHKVIHCVLDKLPSKYHKEFIERFSKAPYDDKIMVFLQEKIKDDVELLIKEAVAFIVVEIVDSMGLLKKNSKIKNKRKDKK